MELEGQFPETTPRDFLSGLDNAERKQLIEAATVVTERIVHHETTLHAVANLLGLLLKEQEQELFNPKLNMEPARAAMNDAATRGELFGIQSAADQLTDGTRLKHLIDRLLTKD